jgi:pyruvate ferredoxin oxidoreductase alpha subunit
MSMAIGASATGARAYTATASQGLLYMIEAVYNAAGLGLPIVMTLANRAIGAPINIWNDHSDAMAVRDAGWVQLFAETNQEAVDLHPLAFALAEQLSVPVMVCMDGFILTHAVERIDLPDQRQIDELLPPFEPRQRLDCDDPVSIGAMVGPEAFTEVRYLAHSRLSDALGSIPALAARSAAVLGREVTGLVGPYRTEGAEVVVVAMGSVLGTIKDVVDGLRSDGVPVGVLGIGCFRPFPVVDVRRELAAADTVVVVEKAFSPGFGGVLSADVALALGAGPARVHTVVAGLGGRPIRGASLRPLLVDACAGRLGSVVFCDLRTGIVGAERERMAADRRSGPPAENVLRDVAASGGGGS